MDEHLGQPCCPPGPDLSVDALAEVDDAWPDSEPPALVAKTVFRRVEREGVDVVGTSAVSDEAACCVRVQSDHEEECEMVGVPERLKALLANFVMRRAVHEHHDEQHEVSSDTTGLSIVNIEGNLRTDL